MTAVSGGSQSKIPSAHVGKPFKVRLKSALEKYAKAPEVKQETGNKAPLFISDDFEQYLIENRLHKEYSLQILEVLTEKYNKEYGLNIRDGSIEIGDGEDQAKIISDIQDALDNNKTCGFYALDPAWEQDSEEDPKTGHTDAFCVHRGKIFVMNTSESTNIFLIQGLAREFGQDKVYLQHFPKRHTLQKDTVSCSIFAMKMLKGFLKEGGKAFNDTILVEGHELMNKHGDMKELKSMAEDQETALSEITAGSFIAPPHICQYSQSRKAYDAHVALYKQYTTEEATDERIEETEEYRKRKNQSRFRPLYSMLKLLGNRESAAYLPKIDEFIEQELFKKFETDASGSKEKEADESEFEDKGPGESEREDETADVRPLPPPTKRVRIKFKNWTPGQGSGQ